MIFETLAYFLAEFLKVSQASNGEDSVAVAIQGLIKNLSNTTQPKPTIFKVDDSLRKVNAKDYEPRIVALGPIHRGKAHLKAMEQHKLRYLQQLLQRRDDLTIEKLVQKVSEKTEMAHPSSKEPDHLLGLIYQCFTPFSTQTLSVGEHRNSLTHINSASELKEAGIRLKRSKQNLLTFKAGVLKFPSLQVSGKTESLLRNLMAYEQLCLDDDHPKHVTDYVFFMNCLIRSTEDIEILRRSGILSNFLGGDDNICLMFDRLGTNFLIGSSDFCYSDVFVSLNRHCGRRHKKWTANLRRNLLLLTLTQTVFAILAFEHRDD